MGWEKTNGACEKNSAIQNPRFLRVLACSTGPFFLRISSFVQRFWKMQLMRRLLLQRLLWSCCSATTLGRDAFPNYSENLFAAQLIGSHFGVPDIPTTYDYVIVGGGTAGLVMARRLAANSSLTVAVVEAGGFCELDNGNFSEIPAFASQFTRM